MVTRRNFIKITAAGGALLSVGRAADAKSTIDNYMSDTDYVSESSRSIPVIAETDVLVIGGSSRAVATAASLSKTDCRVFLLAPLPYLGDDICGSFLYDKRADEELISPLSRKIFTSKNFPTPLHVKTVLENELIDNAIHFLYSSYVSNVLVDEKGTISGVVTVNRSGRQAILCKALVDATHTATVAELTGAKFRTIGNGITEYQYSVVGNDLKESKEIITSEVFGRSLSLKDEVYPVIRYTIKAKTVGDSYASLMDVEHMARELTWDPNQVDSSDLLWYMPSNELVAEIQVPYLDKTIRSLPEALFVPKGVENVWVVGPCIPLNEELKERFMRPINAMFLGECLGEIIGEKVKSLNRSENVIVSQKFINGVSLGMISEHLEHVRPMKDNRFVNSPQGAIPIIGEYDVVVLGGGSAGAPAGVSASKHGAKTLVLEYLHGLGGLSTLGLIGRYWDGYREGFTYEIDKATKGMAPENHPRQLKDWTSASQSDWRMEWYRKEILKNGGRIWFGIIGCGAIVEDNRIVGVVVATPFGRAAILSQVLIDSTGSADIAIAAGVPFDYTGKKTLAVQGAGLGKMDPGDYYVNNDWAFIDDTDIIDVSTTYVQAKQKIQGHYDLVKLPQTRERRRILGEYTVSVYDVIAQRRYSDTISYHRSSFDTHGMVIDPYFILSPPMARHTIYDADVPLRSLLPKGLDGIMTTGLGASAHRDAMPVIRMIACLQNQGYAVGYLASVACKERLSIRNVNIKKIQRHLVAMGNLPKRVLTDKNFKGFAKKDLQIAVQKVTDNYDGLEVLLSEPKQAIRLLSGEMLRATNPDSKLIYASILCVLGDDKHADILADYIKNQDGWDKGWHYTGMGQFGMSLSRLDAIIMSLGKTKNNNYVSVIHDKAMILQPEDYFSHFRAVCMALEEMNSEESADVLEMLLRAPTVRFNALDSYRTARDKTVPGWEDTSMRNRSLKELHLARALFMCGDKGDLAKKTLTNYARGVEGHYARYAYELLTSR